MTQVVVERLVERGVRYLADVSSPAHLSNGCRHFQRMLGFRIARVSLKDEDSILPSAASPSAQPWKPTRLPQHWAHS